MLIQASQNIFVFYAQLDFPGNCSPVSQVSSIQFAGESHECMDKKPTSDIQICFGNHDFDLHPPVGLGLRRFFKYKQNLQTAPQQEDTGAPAFNDPC